MTHLLSPRNRRLAAAVLALLASLAGAGCSALRPAVTPQVSFYALDDARLAAAPPDTVRHDDAQAGPTLLVDPPHASTGYDSHRIVYVRSPHRLEYYAHSEWVDTPARMLGPLLVSAVAGSGGFRAVILGPSAASGSLRLETEVVRLHHDFAGSPSVARFTLRAYVLDGKTRRVIAWREFDETVAATSADPLGGVVAANRAVHAVLERVGRFCTDTALRWTALPATAR